VTYSLFLFFFVICNVYFTYLCKKVDICKNSLPQKSNHLIQKRMSFRLFKSIFEQILFETPLPNGDIWKIQTLENAGLRNNQGWMEVLYRNFAWLIFTT